ncbi:hypothetical protein MN116_006865 [Schistosoma mekongi]|uniref:Peptidase M13 N-terminal domain-containing protein n=1 Tax=Schistosoma mekongi TaxID=38744 RepID=A0AAE2D317_SCHME|nr:hypothetical protein MN116_006865 [Schistosoma mekongi]
MSSSQPHFDDYCISRLKDAFPWTLERHYINSHVNETHKNEIINMFEEMKTTLRSSILNTTWLHANETKFLLDKVQQNLSNCFE